VYYRKGSVEIISYSESFVRILYQ